MVVLICLLLHFILMLPLFRELATFSIEVAIFEMKLPLFYGRFPHFPHYFPHFPYIIGYARLAKLLYETLLFGCKLNIILNGKWTSFRWCGWHLKSDLIQDVRAWGWRAAIKSESDAGHRSLRLADNDKISHKGHRTALRCCRCPFYTVGIQFTTK